MKKVKDKIVFTIKNAYFWQRLVVLSLSLFFFSLFVRVSNDFLPLVFLIFSLASGVWLLFALSKKGGSSTLGNKPVKPLWIRLVAMVTLVPIVVTLSPVLGFGVGLTVNPYTAEELAANEAREASAKVEREAREAAEKLEREAREDREAAEKVEQEDREALEQFPQHVKEVIEQFEKSGYACEDPSVYLSNGNAFLESEYDPDGLNCNESDSNILGDDFNVFASKDEAASYYQESCNDRPGGWRIGAYMISPTVQMGPFGENLDQANELARALGYPKAQEIGSSCDYSGFNW